MLQRHHSIEEELAALRAAGLYRSLRALSCAGGHARVDGGTVLNFSSNDYLDLANDLRLKVGAAEAVERYGCGATASRLMAGHLELHAELERRLAALVGQETALVFPTGFQANVGVLTALAGPEDAIFSDALNHASIVDGCRLSRAAVHIYPHRDMDALEVLLQHSGRFRRRIIVSDSVFS
ncbi:MAG: aminotransferase class I/II-fold pyridoxal phosphate-dependent enzyme, partial [Candidatus Hydrogenedentales bacterium]